MDRAQLTSAIDFGAIDAVLVAFPYLQGRPVGKRMTGPAFSTTSSRTRMGACVYLLGVDTDPPPGYQLANWEIGDGDAVGRDLASRRSRGDAAMLAVQAGTGLEWVWPNRVGVADVPEQPLMRASGFHPSAQLVAVGDERDLGARPLRGMVPNRHLIAPGMVLAHVGRSAMTLEISEWTTGQRRSDVGRARAVD